MSLDLSEVALSGTGMTAFGKQPGLSLANLATAAALSALADAGLSAADVGAVYFGNALAGEIGGQSMVAGQVALRTMGLDGIPFVNIENACATSATAFNLACTAIVAGACEVALVIGAESMTRRGSLAALRALAGALDVDEIFPDGVPADMSHSPFMDVYARKAEHLLSAGLTRADFARAAAKNQRHAALNPQAQYGHDATVEEVLASRPIAGPLTLLMCSPISDGAAAAVLTTRDRARHAGTDALRVLASQVSSGVPGGRLDPPHAVGQAAWRAFEQAGLGPWDVAVAELHDATAPAELELYAQVGLTDTDGIAKLIREGVTDLGGALPVNTSGGLLGRGHPIGATGLAQIHEVALQLRGLAGRRQVPGARVGLTQNSGGWMDGPTGGDNIAASVTILARGDVGR